MGLLDDEHSMNEDEDEDGSAQVIFMLTTKLVLNKYIMQYLHFYVATLLIVRRLYIFKPFFNYKEVCMIYLCCFKTEFLQLISYAYFCFVLWSFIPD